MDEDYFFQIEDEITDDRLFILIIYDITNNSKRVKFAKLLLGYGFRIQKSAFEAVLTKTKYEKLKQEIPEFVDKEEDSIRIYQIKGKTQAVSYTHLVAEDEKELQKRMLIGDSKYVRTYGKNKMYTGKNVATKLWVGNYHSDCNTFEEMAKKSEGIERIGVLKMCIRDRIRTMYQSRCVKLHIHRKIQGILQKRNCIKK